MDIDEFDDLKIILWLILFLLFGIVIITCKQDSGNYLMTIKGPIKPSLTGITQEHKHILVDIIDADSTYHEKWDKENVISKTMPRIIEIKKGNLC